MFFIKRKIKRNIGSKNGNTFTFFKFELHKEIKDSNYNSKLGILGIVAISCATAAAICFVFGTMVALGKACGSYGNACHEKGK